MPADIAAQTGFLIEKSVGPWLAVWAVRYRWNLDYRLSANARLVRWGVVAVGYSMALGSTIRDIRLAGVLVGLAFLCWPNFAYHLT